MKYPDRDQVGAELRARLPGCHVGVGRPGEDRITVRLGDGLIVLAGDRIVVTDAGEPVDVQMFVQHRKDWSARLVARVVALAAQHLGAVPEDP